MWVTCDPPGPFQHPVLVNDGFNQTNSPLRPYPWKNNKYFNWNK